MFSLLTNHFFAGAIVVFLLLFIVSCLVQIATISINNKASVLKAKLRVEEKKIDLERIQLYKQLKNERTRHME